MKFTKTASVEELQVVSRFESLRKILQSEQYVDHLKKPLIYWALQTDRRLPLAFLGRTLGDLLRASFSELSSTPGIGQKKICSFVKLLARAANTDPAELPLDNVVLPNEADAAAHDEAAVDDLDPATISEVVWGQWRASISKHGLGDEKMGQFAPTLRHMTRVIWNTPLGAYTHFNLADVRSMKTHGEKRVRAILEVFRGVHLMVADMGTQEHLVVRIMPRLIDKAERWIGQALQSPSMPSAESLYDNLIKLLLEQVRNDSTQQIASLAENRLGLTGPITSVRQVARAMGLTRARVYQLLNEINDIMAVRWPHGRHQMYELRDKLIADSRLIAESKLRKSPDVLVDKTEGDIPTLLESKESPKLPAEFEQFMAAVELFYPGNRRGASGALDTMLDEEEELEHVQADEPVEAAAPVVEHELVEAK